MDNAKPANGHTKTPPGAGVLDAVASYFRQYLVCDDHPPLFAGAKLNQLAALPEENAPPGGTKLPSSVSSSGDMSLMGAD